VTPPGSLINPVSDLAGSTTLRPWAPSVEEETAPAEQGGGSDSSTDDDDQPSASENGTAVPWLPLENGAAALISLVPLSLRPAASVPVAAENTSAARPAIPLESALFAADRADSNQGKTPIGPASKSAQQTEQKTIVPGEAAPAMPASGQNVPKADQPQTLPVHATEPPAAPAPAAGMTSALPIQQMSMGQKMNIISGLEEQNLSGVQAELAHVGTEKAGARSNLPSPVDGSPGAHCAWVQPATTSGTARAGEEVARLSPVDPTARVLDLMSSVVVQLRQTGREDFEVAIHPDGETEIFLHVSMQNGGAEIHAELRRGDGAAFASRWQELQDRLAQQGVKLAALATGEELTGQFGSNSGFSSPQRDWAPKPEDLLPSFSETITNRSHGLPAPVLPSAGRGWQTWA
jgi:hypothetical protein